MYDAIGTTFETATLRCHVYRPSIEVTELLGAGKRGKKVRQFTVYDIDMVRDSGVRHALERWFETLRTGTFEDVRGGAEALVLVADGCPKFHERLLRGVDVAPPGRPKLVVPGPGFYLEVEWDTFLLRDTSDPYNDPTCIPAHGQKKGPPLLYAWVEKERAALAGMTFSSVWEKMRSLGVGVHYYCAVD